MVPMLGTACNRIFCWRVPVVGCEGEPRRRSLKDPTEPESRRSRSHAGRPRNRLRCHADPAARQPEHGGSRDGSYADGEYSRRDVSILLGNIV